MPDANNIVSSEANSQAKEEINTYDFPVLPIRSNGSNNSYDNINPKKIVLGIYKFIATVTVILTLIFSATDLIGFFASEMNTEEALLKRVFGSSASNSTDLFELIINQSFGNALHNTQLPPSIKDPIVSEQSKPIETPDTSLPEETPTTPPTTQPPETEPPISKLPENAHPIISMDMSLLSYGKHFIYNDTSLSPNISSLSNSPLKKIYKSDGPLVLVLHTHATEAFMNDGATYYTDSGELARSDNLQENMIAVGKAFVAALENNGIEAIHCTTLHDKESYRESYARSAETIKWYLKQYPSIRYVFDLHRDSLMKPTEELISAVTYINGERYAQIMPVIGSGFTGYEHNLIFALKLREALNTEYYNISRPVCLRESQYNQSLAPVSLLLEIGTSGNTLTEAKRSAALTAKVISNIIKEQCG